MMEELTIKKAYSCMRLGPEIVRIQLAIWVKGSGFEGAFKLRHICLDEKLIEEITWHEEIVPVALPIFLEAAFKSEFEVRMKRAFDIISQAGLGSPQKSQLC